MLSVGIGGSALGPQFVAEALAPDNPPLKVRWCSSLGYVVYLIVEFHIIRSGRDSGIDSPPFLCGLHLRILSNGSQSLLEASWKSWKVEYIMRFAFP